MVLVKTTTLITMCMKARGIILSFVLMGMCLAVSAQVNDFRNPGFKVSVALTDQLGVFVGADVSMGYMLTRQHYLGIGVGTFFLPKDETIPFYGNLFADYRYFFKPARNSLFAGSQLGFSHAFNYGRDTGIQYWNSLLLSPNVGWYWGHKSGKGLMLGLGATLIAPIGGARTDRKILALPKISFGLEF